MILILRHRVKLRYKRCMAKKADSQQTQRAQLERAMATWLHTSGHLSPTEARRTATRCTTLWCEHLLAGTHANLRRVVGRGAAATCQTPVCVTGIGVHMVCPHHLTVAFGEAHIAYVPHQRMLGFGALSRLAQACTARLVLQEQATQDMADAMVTLLDAPATLVRIEAMHPCHNIPYPRSHRARAITEASHGKTAEVRALRALLAARST